MMKTLAVIGSTSMSGINVAVPFALLFLICSCGQTESNKLPEGISPIGKWKAISLQNINDTIFYDTNRNYVLEIGSNKNLTVTAEDNILTSTLIKLGEDSLSIGDMTMTDVCCNSDTANTFFQFFTVSAKFSLQGDLLNLVSEKGKLELGK